MNYKDLHLKTKRAFTTKFFKENNITLENIGEEKLIALNTVLSTTPSSDRQLAFYQMIISETTLEKNLVKRFEKYLKSKINTEEFYRLKFGDEYGLEKYQSVGKSRGGGNTLEGQIKKYGKEEGARRYNEMNSKRAHTLDNFIRIHGEAKGREMYKSTMAKKAMSLENFQNKYGDEEGLNRYNEWKAKCISTEENFINRHGEKLGKQKWQDFKDKSKSTKENFIRRHGKVEGEKRYKLFCERSANTKENFIRVHGFEEGTKKWEVYKNSNAGYKASKESLEFFKHLTKHLLTMDLELDDLWFGSNDSIEFKIESDNKLYSYDYTILSLKLIFEFNGNHVHPSRELLGEKWNDWRCAWTSETADEKHSMDMEKISIAEKEGFTVLEIWDYEDKKEALEKCIKLVEERI